MIFKVPLNPKHSVTLYHKIKWIKLYDSNKPFVAETVFVTVTSDQFPVLIYFMALDRHHLLEVEPTSTGAEHL